MPEVAVETTVQFIFPTDKSFELRANLKIYSVSREESGKRDGATCHAKR